MVLNHVFVGIEEEPVYGKIPPNVLLKVFNLRHFVKTLCYSFHTNVNKNILGDF